MARAVTKPVKAGVAAAPEQSTEVAVVESFDDEFEQYQGDGLGNVTADNLMIPRLGIIQKLSPQLDKNKSEYIKEAEVGDIVDVGTGDLFKEGIIFLPVLFKTDWLEWAPRASGRGLINIHRDSAILEQCTVDEKKRNVLPNGNYIAETAQFFGLNVTADLRKSFIPMTSTQLRKSRKWNTLSTGERIKNKAGQLFMPPLWYRFYSLTTGHESNSEGDWEGWVINRSVSLPEAAELGLSFGWRDIKALAVEFSEQLAKGEAVADASHMAGDSAEAAEPAM